MTQKFLCNLRVRNLNHYSKTRCNLKDWYLWLHRIFQNLSSTLMFLSPAREQCKRTRDIWVFIGIYLIWVYVVWTWVPHCTQVPQCPCGGHRTICKNQFSPSTHVGPRVQKSYHQAWHLTSPRKISRKNNLTVISKIIFWDTI